MSGNRAFYPKSGTTAGTFAAGNHTHASLDAVGAATTTDVVTAAVTGDTQKRLIVNGDGSLEWGSGSAAQDIKMYRSAADELSLDDCLKLNRTGASSNILQGYVNGEGAVRLFMKADGTLHWSNGSGGPDVILYRQTTDVLATDDSLALRTTGKGLQIKEGSNARMGVATLVAGTVTVSNTSVTASTRIFLSVQSLGTVSIPRAVGVTARTASTSFTITSEDATDTSVVAWHLIEPAS